MSPGLACYFVESDLMTVSFCNLPDKTVPKVEPSFLTVTPSNSSAEKGKHLFRIETCGEDVGRLFLTFFQSWVEEGRSMVPTFYDLLRRPKGYFSLSGYGEITFNR